jgi:membrane fusion protein (multidrug efflux system)
MSGGNWVVTGGLNGGDQIVVSGLQKIKDGAQAKATPWHAAPPAGGNPSPAASGTAPSGK